MLRQFYNQLSLGTLGVSHYSPVLGRAAPLGGGITFCEFRTFVKRILGKVLFLSCGPCMSKSNHESEQSPKFGQLHE